MEDGAGGGGGKPYEKPQRRGLGCSTTDEQEATSQEVNTRVQLSRGWWRQCQARTHELASQPAAPAL